MTIASAFNEIAVANGGTADTSGTIAGAIDACVDALAGSDVAQRATIEDSVRVLGEYISGGGGGGTVEVYTTFDNIDFPIYIDGQAVGLVEPGDVEGFNKFNVSPGSVVSVPYRSSSNSVFYAIYPSKEDFINRQNDVCVVAWAAEERSDNKIYFPAVPSGNYFMVFGLD